MALLDQVRAACTRLAPAGWGELLARHGLDLSASDLAAELARTLPAIDRTLAGFEDFAAEGRRGIEPGIPAHSLLYHAFASPQVLTAPGGRPLGGFPTRAEIEAVENYVFGVRTPSLAELTQRFPGGLMAVAVFAAEYRPAAETVHRRHADLCFARTGVARVGSSAARYEPDLRGFRPTVTGDDHALRVLPSAFAAYLAVQLRGDAALFGPMGFDRLWRVPPEIRDVVGPPDARDGDLDFWVPVHKLFSGTECLRDRTLTVGFQARHVNEKIRRVHLFLRAQGLDSGFGPPAIDGPPFSFSAGIAGFSRSAAIGTGVLVPVAHAPLVQPAVFRGAPLSFRVPADAGNRWAPSLQLRSRGGNRSAPEYVHARHLVEAGGTVRDLNDLEDVAGRVRQGGYRAQHYVDFTGDGFVRATCPELTGVVPRSVPAYSLVTAPDFYPNCDQRELLEWWFERVPSGLRERIWPENFPAPPPLTLADGRLPPNLQLRGAGFRPEDRTVTAIVALPHRGPRAQRPLTGAGTRRHAHLPDAASNVFAPGWDTSRDQTDGVTHLAAYGLGSPFPEDAKLCAALSSFWPAVAPDAGRSFDRGFPTATPMTDEEIGSLGALPWDGIPGPRARRAGGATTLIDYHRFDHADYVRSALDQRFSLALTARVDSEEYETRMLALARSLLALRADPTGDRWRVISFRVITPDDPELRRAELEAGTQLGGARYRIVFAQLDDTQPQPAGADHRRVRLPVTATADAFGGSARQLLLRRAGAGWRAVTTL